MEQGVFLFRRGRFFLLSAVLVWSGLPFAGVKAAFPDVFRASPVSGSGINRNAPGTGPGASWLAFLLVQKFSVFRTSRVILFLQVFFPYWITGKKVLFVRRPGIAGR